MWQIIDSFNERYVLELTKFTDNMNTKPTTTISESESKINRFKQRHCETDLLPLPAVC